MRLSLCFLLLMVSHARPCSRQHSEREYHDRAAGNHHVIDANHIAGSGQQAGFLRASIEENSRASKNSQ